jgi:hypothetical protein
LVLEVKGHKSLRDVKIGVIGLGKMGSQIAKTFKVKKDKSSDLYVSNFKFSKIFFVNNVFQRLRIEKCLFGSRGDSNANLLK